VEASAIGRGAWALPSAIRGEVLEAKLGKNTPRTFDVIDIWDGQKKIMANITTVDLKGAYQGEQGAKNLRSLLRENIDEVATFRGARRAGLEIKSSDLVGVRRQVLLGIEPGVQQSAEQARVIQESIEYGRKLGVEVVVVPIK
jgi:hypothetical protein